MVPGAAHHTEFGGVLGEVETRSKQEQVRCERCVQARPRACGEGVEQIWDVVVMVGLSAPETAR